ncbi:claudin-15-like [Pimephales promelas]|uniref:claudin-15-like n=1 Tax=Pimephales promelas TaxID=90988 RepID=UPI0019559593|nr:claudin-15-like [Pimephales promelas]
MAAGKMAAPVEFAADLCIHDILQYISSNILVNIFFFHKGFPLLFSLHTNDCTAKDPSVKLLKIADDTTVICLIHNGLIQACRALMITSIVLGAFGLVATLVGMQCSKIGGENYIMKGRIAGAGGVFFILQGLCTMIAVSWYAFNITQEFFDPLYPGIKYEIGEGLYIGWSSAIMALCGGSCLLFSCGLCSREEKKSHLQNFRSCSYQAQSRHMVQTASTISRVPSSQYRLNAYV